MQTTANIPNAVRAKYTAKYFEAAMMRRVYDQLAVAVGESQHRLEQGNWMGSSYVLNFLSDMRPSSTAISQTVDITPQILADATTVITPTSRADAIQWAESVDVMAYTNYGASVFERVGRAMMESVDNLAEAAALQGGLVISGAARASLDAGTAAHRFSDAHVAQAGAMLETLKCKPFLDGTRQAFVAIVHPDAFFDLLNGGNVLNVGIYQNQSILFNQELGSYGKFRFVVTPWAKVFAGAGAAHALPVATTLSANAAALSTSITVALATNITAGRTLRLGTAETGSTFHDTNEMVRVSSTYTSGTTIPIIGEGSNGGLRFAQASAVAVSNADNVYPIAYGGEGSLLKVFANEVGEYGQVVGPKEDGLVNQFRSVGYKFYGGYGRVAESYILRGECASSLQA